MFLEATLKNNPELIEAAAAFHKKGLIEPNTYCVDLDSVWKNANLIAETGKKLGINLYFMTKQFGRNPVVAKTIVQAGIESSVAVDMDEARVLYKNGIAIGHMGHIVQVPRALLNEALQMKPEVVTCFSLEKAREINDAAGELGIVQNILLRVVDDGDCMYPGQEGGIPLKDLERTALAIKKFANVRIIGVTSFPCLLYDYDSAKIEPTANLYTITTAARQLKDMGFDIAQINAPSVTCVSTIPLLKETGATHGEPGHSLTGTTPLHSRGHEPEVQSMVYVTEVSHSDEKRAYVFGGGFYPRSRLEKAYIPGKKLILEARDISPESIDYYTSLETEGTKLYPGETVIYSFRTQIFVTRSKVAIIEGIHKGEPRILGIFNSMGDRIR
jgi:predicted amino acid racemase